MKIFCFKEAVGYYPGHRFLKGEKAGDQNPVRLARWSTVGTLGSILGSLLKSGGIVGFNPDSRRLNAWAAALRESEPCSHDTITTRWGKSIHWLQWSGTHITPQLNLDQRIMNTASHPSCPTRFSRAACHRFDDTGLHWCSCHCWKAKLHQGQIFQPVSTYQHHYITSFFLFRLITHCSHQPSGARRCNERKFNSAK